MGLKPAAVARAPHEDEQPEVPDGIPRHAGHGRPKIRVRNDPMRMEYYARASSLGKPIDDAFLIDRAEVRRVVHGLAVRPDLYELAQAVPGCEERADKDELWRLAGLAKEAGGASTRANRGTALHKLADRADAGEDLAFVGPQLRAALDVWRRLMDGFTIHGAEQFVVNDPWFAAGSYDRLVSPKHPMTAPDGSVITPDDRMIMDLKSGRWGEKFFGPTYLVQQAVYATGTPYAHISDELASSGAPLDGGRIPWEVAPSRRWAIIPHVPIESPQDAALWWVDLTYGAELAELSFRIGQARREGNAGFMPADPPRAPVPDAPVWSMLTVLGQLRKCVTIDELGAVYSEHAEFWTPACTELADEMLTKLEEQS